MVADGLPLFGGAHLAIDTTVVSGLRVDGTAGRRAATHDGVATVEARRRKCRTDPEFAGLHGRARLVVLAVEVGSRWSHERRVFTEAKARDETELMRRRAEQSWRSRWGSFLACTVAWAVASTMLELPGARGADGDTLRHKTWSGIVVSAVL